MEEFTKEEKKITEAALGNIAARYESLAKEINYAPVSEVIQEKKTQAKNALRKLRKKDSGNECLFIFVPDGIHDKELEDKLRSKVPEHPDFPDEKNVFWSSEYENFVVRGYKEEAEEAIRERYGEDVTIVKGPEWASKKNTWQIVEE